MTEVPSITIAKLEDRDQDSESISKTDLKMKRQMEKSVTFQSSI